MMIISFKEGMELMGPIRFMGFIGFIGGAYCILR